MVGARRGRCTVERRVGVLLQMSCWWKIKMLIARDSHDIVADPGIYCLGGVDRLAARKHPVCR